MPPSRHRPRAAGYTDCPPAGGRPVVKPKSFRVCLGPTPLSAPPWPIPCCPLAVAVQAKDHDGDGDAVQDGDDDEKDCALLHGCELHVVISFLATSSCPESFPPDAPTLWPRLGQALFGITAPSALRKSENFSGLPPPPRHIADCGGGVGGYYNAKFCRSRRARRAAQRPKRMPCRGLCVAGIWAAMRRGRGRFSASIRAGGCAQGDGATPHFGAGPARRARTRLTINGNPVILNDSTS